MDFKILATDLGFTEGPTALDDGTLWVTSIDRGAIYHLEPGGEIIEMIETGGRPNGLTVDDEGSLYVTQAGDATTPAGIQIVVDGKVRHIVTGLDMPNDLCFAADGRLYFTDPRDTTCDILDRATVVPGRIFACDRDGGHLQLLHEGMLFPNGLAFDETGEILYVAETATPHRIFRSVTTSGQLSQPAEFGFVDAGVPDGMAVDVEGRVWVAAVRGTSVQVFDTDGQLVKRLDCGEGSRPTNLCFAIDRQVLYVTDAGRGGVLCFDVDVRGAALFR
jgi:gluconolactonase